MPTFVNPFLLWGLGLVSVPIIIHLLNRRRFRIVRWAAMEYLLAANRRNRRRVRLEHFLVLLLRCLAIALIVAAVARPVSTSGTFSFLPGVQDRVERVLVFDDSGSMSYQEGRTSSYERGRRLVKQLVEDLRATREGDQLTAFRASRLEPDLIAAGLSETRIDAYLKRLKEAEPVARTFDVPGVLDHVLTRIMEVEDAPTQKVVYVVTDQRARDWIGPQGLLPKAIADVLQRAPESVRFLVVDVGSEQRGNLSLTEFSPVEKLAMVDVPLELSIRVANRGEEPVFDVPLALEAGDVRIPLPPIPQIKAGEEAELRHRYTFAGAGVRSLTVRLSDDNLRLDDQRFLAIRVQEALKVLLVDGEEGVGPLQNETDLLRLALSPSGDILTGVDPVVTTPQALGEEDLASYDSVIVCNVERWPADRLSELQRYVSRGGGLAMFLGDQVDAEAWTRELYDGGEGLLPCALGRRLEEPTFDEAPGILPPEEDHPLVTVYQGERNPFLKRVRGRVRFSCPVERDGLTRVVLRFEDPSQTPFVLEKPYGRGRTILFNTTADLAWSSWPRDPSYPITAQEVVRLLAPAATTGRNLACGEPLERSVNPAHHETHSVLRLPAQEEELPPRDLHAEPREGSEMLWFNFGDTELAGIYSLELKARQPEYPSQDFFAVNLDAAEGDTRLADSAQIMPALEGLPIRFAKPSEQMGLLTLSDGSKSELWRTCLIALLIALALEQGLAWYAAHHAKAQPVESAGAAA